MSYKNVVMERCFTSIPEGSFENTEQRIGVKFPYPLYDLIKNNDEGCPKDCELKLLAPDGRRFIINGLDAFLSFNPRYTNNMLAEYFNRPEHFPQDERFVPFGLTGNGDYFLFFYEAGKNDPQPKVYYWAHEYSDIEGGLVFLANSFEEFLDMLKPEGYYD
jgi:SMI1-KNR4 cell-wall